MKERWVHLKAFVGTGVICETWGLQAAVIPAKAGIRSVILRKCAVDKLDSRFRGNGAARLMAATKRCFSVFSVLLKL
jgi:hypothetical protein